MSQTVRTRTANQLASAMDHIDHCGHCSPWFREWLEEHVTNPALAAHCRRCTVCAAEACRNDPPCPSRFHYVDACLPALKDEMGRVLARQRFRLCLAVAMAVQVKRCTG